MIIELPKEFTKRYCETKYVIVRKGILEIHGGCDFEKLMIEMSFLIRGRTKCYYCGKMVDPKKITIDHCYPRDFGGVSITSNLRPACGSCNSSKSNLNAEEFRLYMTLEKLEKKEYYKSILAKKERKKYSKKNRDYFDLPKSWVKIVNLGGIRVKKRMDTSGGRKFTKTLNFAQRYGKLPRPLVVTSNYVLVNGTVPYDVACKLKMKKVPVIVLNNVKYFDK